MCIYLTLFPVHVASWTAVTSVFPFCGINQVNQIWSTDVSVKNRTITNGPHFRYEGSQGGGDLISYYILTRLMTLEPLTASSVSVLTLWSEELVHSTYDFLLVAFGFGCFLELSTHFISSKADGWVPHCKKYLQLVVLFAERIYTNFYLLLLKV